MKKLSIYLDTSVLGGCFEREFAPWSLGLMADLREGRFLPVISEMLEAELTNAPARVQALYNEIAPIAGKVLTAGVEELALVRAYQERGVLGPKCLGDMLHMALATVAGVDVVVSWNFKHIVRFDRIRAFNAVNLEQGYKAIDIHSPREVTTYGNDRNQRG